MYPGPFLGNEQVYQIVDSREIVRRAMESTLSHFCKKGYLAKLCRVGKSVLKSRRDVKIGSQRWLASRTSRIFISFVERRIIPNSLEMTACGSAIIASLVESTISGSPCAVVAKIDASQLCPNRERVPHISPPVSLRLKRQA
jgi:hypothetical protein